MLTQESIYKSIARSYYNQLLTQLEKILGGRKVSDRRLLDMVQKLSVELAVQDMVRQSQLDSPLGE